ncbi:hypothetical protein BB560_004917 [Smittium megazygosporum]|uniref:5'-3' exoribonuclease n=1 Tax=Smittium megazygosporum TaxID=133381 RepID=A0A2T9Z7W4_9FUNG|nr:hypothetical protein BB560_004917 [Smittium megazygosporum]
MGVPAFYRWLINKYPKVETPAVEESPTVIDGFEIPVDTSKPNPNGFEIDNLYLDMNGIVHPCCHPQDKPAPETEDEMYFEVFKCLDRVFNLVRPRKTIYMALDGVAPRAKMNQQRSRRFRTAQEAKLEKIKKEQLMKDHNEATNGSAQLEKEPWDSNCITPGTPFMEKLARALRYYVAEKLNTEPTWSSINVIISDSNVPGEGEHKLMEFIRNQRLSKDYNPNTSHCIYGLDADLIMLALATHEPHFKILRDDVNWESNSKSGCRKCGEKTHIAKFCNASELMQNMYKQNKKSQALPFVFCNIDILREYLALQLLPPKGFRNTWNVQKGPVINLERAIDDWVFLCYFVGNDFLPHLPSLEIREGALDKIVNIWKSLMFSMGDYVTNNGVVNLCNLQEIMKKLSVVEATTFANRKSREDMFNQRDNFKNNSTSNPEQLTPFNNTAPPKSTPISENASIKNVNDSNRNVAKKLKDILLESDSDQDSLKIDNTEPTPVSQSKDSQVSPTNNHNNRKRKLPGSPTESDENDTDDNNHLSKTHKPSESNQSPALSDQNQVSEDQSNNSDESSESDGSEPEDDIEEELLSGTTHIEETDEQLDSDNVPETLDEELGPDTLDLSKEDPEKLNGNVILDAEDSLELINRVDNVRLWEEGYKGRYYESKFQISENNSPEISQIVKSYVEGLCWVLQYYYKGCVSWGWYYPYHYAPLASDFLHLEDYDIHFELGAPLKPFEQLMSVLPAASKSNLPEPFANLMEDGNSSILDFYPETFKVDLNGKRYSWQGVALLPFIDEKRLIEALEPLQDQLTESEIARNSLGYSVVRVSAANSIADKLNQLYGKTSEAELIICYNHEFHIEGKFEKDESFIPHTTFVCPIVGFGKYDIEQDTSVSAKIDLIHNNNNSENQPSVVAVNKHNQDLFSKCPTVSLIKGVTLPPPRLNKADQEFVFTRGKSGYRGRIRGNNYGNNRDFSHFYRQQGNDVYYDRGYSSRGGHNDGDSSGYGDYQPNKYEPFYGKFPEQNNHNNYNNRPQRPYQQNYNQHQNYRPNQNSNYRGNQNGQYRPNNRNFNSQGPRPQRPQMSFNNDANSRYNYGPGRRPNMNQNQYDQRTQNNYRNNRGNYRR